MAQSAIGHGPKSGLPKQREPARELGWNMRLVFWGMALIALFAVALAVGSGV